MRMVDIAYFDLCKPFDIANNNICADNTWNKDQRKGQREGLEMSYERSNKQNATPEPTQQKTDLYSNPDTSPKIITEAASEPLLSSLQSNPTLLQDYALKAPPESAVAAGWSPAAPAKSERLHCEDGEAGRENERGGGKGKSIKSLEVFVTTEALDEQQEISLARDNLSEAGILIGFGCQGCGYLEGLFYLVISRYTEPLKTENSGTLSIFDKDILVHVTSAAMHFKGPDEPIDFAVLSQNSDLYEKNAPKGHSLSSFTKESLGFAGISLSNKIQDIKYVDNLIPKNPFAHL
ncbi:hypothetical protein TURU_031878 [Turdus rufiventris]|nr:hypothetical protein TURU_031878 [Turdus rufiventris]